MIIDATDLILGRVGTEAAKHALLGEKVDIVNAEKIVVTGDKKEILAKYAQLFSRGIPRGGPYYYKMPDRFVKRAIRGMLPYKKDRGEQAFKRITCHIGVPETMKDQKSQSIKEAHVQKLPHNSYITVQDICKQMGAHI